MKQCYDSYKPSGINWIGDIPSHWSVIPVKHVLDNLDYLRQPISAEDRERNNPKYDYYGASGVIDQIDFYNVDDTVLLIGEDGANLVMRNLPLIYRASGKFWVNNHAHILKPKNGHNYSYLAHLLEAGDYTLFITGSAQPKLSQENLNKYPICIPPLAEQEAIAAWLDEKCEEIDAAIAKVDREIELIDELKQSEISRVVTRGLNPDTPLRPSGIDWIGDIPEHWEIASFKRSIRINNGCDYKHVVADEGYPVIGSGGQFAYATGYLYDGEVLLLGRKGTIDRPMYFVGKFWTVDTMFYAVPNKDICCKYMYYQALGFPFDYYSTSTALPSMAANDLANNPIAVPPLSEQQAIADYLDKKCADMDGLKAKLTKKRETLKELRQSIISEVVTGKRKVI